MQKKLYVLYVLILAILVAAYVYYSGSYRTHHMAHHVEHDVLKVTDAYARASSPTAKSGAIFFVIENGTEEEQLLTGAKADIANRVELHTHKAGENGVMMMTEIEGGVKVEPKHVSKFKRGGNHVMLMGLKQSLNNGDVIPVELIFKNKIVRMNVIVDNDRKPSHDEMHH
jgi:copper(I)-binding protein